MESAIQGAALGYAQDEGIAKWNELAGEYIKTKDPFRETTPDGKTRRRKLAPNATKEEQKAWKKVKSRAWLDDKCFMGCYPVSCGIGLGPIVVLLPVIGPVLMYAVHAKMIEIAMRGFHIDGATQAKMHANIVFDLVISMVPVLGTFFEWLNGCSTRNAAIVHTYVTKELAERQRQETLAMNPPQTSYTRPPQRPQSRPQPRPQAPIVPPKDNRETTLREYNHAQSYQRLQDRHTEHARSVGPTYQRENPYLSQLGNPSKRASVGSPTLDPGPIERPRRSVHKVPPPYKNATAPSAHPQYHSPNPNTKGTGSTPAPHANIPYAGTSPVYSPPESNEHTRGTPVIPLVELQSLDMAPDEGVYTTADFYPSSEPGATYNKRSSLRGVRKPPPQEPPTPVTRTN